MFTMFQAMPLTSAAAACNRRRAAAVEHLAAPDHFNAIERDRAIAHGNIDVTGGGPAASGAKRAFAPQAQNETG
jgi:hypothetical protein